MSNGRRLSTTSVCSGVLLLLLLVLADAASVGQDVVINQPAREATAAAAPARTNRRAGPPRGQARQAAAEGGFGIEDPSLLPDCVPGNGVICSDRDYTGLLQANPANIDLTDDNFAFAGVRPSAEASLGLAARFDPVTDSFGASLKGTDSLQVDSNIGGEALNVATKTSTTAAGADVKGRVELALPEKLTVTLGKVGSETVVDRRTNRPNFWYFLGQNAGLPIGLSLAADGVSGKK